MANKTNITAAWWQGNSHGMVKVLFTGALIYTLPNPSLAEAAIAVCVINH